MNVQLFIEGEEIELDKSVQFPLNKTFDDLSNPTNYIVDYTKSVKIPNTAKNNRTFGHLLNLDRLIVDGEGMGIYCDPTKKLSFRLMLNGELLVEGYAKMGDADKDGYNVNLFGKLGDVFNELSKCSFNGENGDEYKIDDPYSEVHYMSGAEVKHSIDNRQTQMSLDGCQDSDIIGFALTNEGLWDGFDSKDAKTSTGGTESFAKALENHWGASGGNDVVGDGMSWREYGEFRCYYARPYVYVNKLVQILQNKCQSLTGYSIELDEQFFNIRNPYYRDLVYTLPLLSRDGTKHYDILTLQAQQFPFNVRFGKVGSTDLGSGATSSLPYYKDGAFFYFNFTTNEKTYKFEQSNISFTTNYEIPNNDAIVFELRAVERGTSAVLKNWKEYFVSENSTLAQNITDGVIEVIDSNERNYLGTFNIKNCDELNGREFYLQVYAHYYSATLYKSKSNASTNVQMIVDNINVEQHEQVGDFQRFKMGDLFASDFNILDWFINYCRMFGLIFSVDYIEKKINVQMRNTYFSNIEVLDWTDKINTTSGYVVSPVSFDSRKVVFNYDDVDAKFLTSYKEEKGFNYGGKRLITAYQFNDTSKDLFKGYKTGIVVNDSCRDWNAMYYYKDFSYKATNELLPTLYKEDGKKRKYIGMEGRYFFRNRNRYFDTTIKGGRIGITGDNEDEIEKNNFLYHYNPYEEGAVTYQYPRLDIVNDTMQCGCLFALPEIVHADYYGIIGKNADDSTFIYENYWKDYINERYSVQNKKLVANFYLTDADFLGFDFNKFVKIGDNVFIVNKIIDFNFGGGLTKCELLQVHNFNAYKSGQSIQDVSPSMIGVNDTDYIFYDSGDKYTFPLSCDVDMNVNYIIGVGFGTGWTLKIDGVTKTSGTMTTITKGEHEVEMTYNGSTDDATLIFSFEMDGESFAYPIYFIKH